MDIPGSAYLYTVAVLGMTFIGFSAIVMMLRQTLGLTLRPFDILIAHIYMEFGLIISVGALLPPLFAAWGLPAPRVWQLSSALLGVPLLLIGLTYPARRRAASDEAMPWYTRLNIAVLIVIGIGFLTNASGLMHERVGPIFLTALTAFMTFAVATWLRALSIMFLKTPH